MSRSLQQCVDDLKPTLDAQDESTLAEIFDALVEFARTDPEEVEPALGWGVLVACEKGLHCVSEYVDKFLEAFPDSVLPVKVELAENLAGNGQFDAATQFAREYLRLIHDSGHLADIEQFTNIRVGASKAYLLLTAAYTEVGARSYSRRILEHAMTRPLLPDFLRYYQSELARIRDELQDPDNQRLDEMWEQFFEDGTYADDLYRFCEDRECPMLARRVDLLEMNFRFKNDYHLDSDEPLQLIYRATSDGPSEESLLLA